MIDEGPSPEDLERFGGETGYCPSCGAEIWDDVSRCPECGVWLSGGTQSRPPEIAAARQRLFTIIAILTLLAFSGLLYWLL